MKIVFYFLHDLSKNQGVVTSLDGINGRSVDLDVTEGVIMTRSNRMKFRLNTIVLAIFQIFVYGNVVYAQTWEVLTLKNCIESP